MEKRLKKPQKEEVEKLPEGGRLIKAIPKVIFDGNCNHYYKDIGRDKEGVMNAKCIRPNCPMGIRYDTKKERLVNGKRRPR